MSAASRPSKPSGLTAVSPLIELVGELRPGRLGQLLELEGGLRAAGDVGQDAVDLERAAERLEVDREPVLGGLGRGVLGVDRAEGGGPLGDDPVVAVGEGRAAAHRVDGVVEQQAVEQRRLLAELVDDEAVDVVLGVERRLGEGDGHRVVLLSGPLPHGRAVSAGS